MLKPAAARLGVLAAGVSLSSFAVTAGLTVWSLHLYRMGPLTIAGLLIAPALAVLVFGKMLGGLVSAFGPWRSLVWVSFAQGVAYLLMALVPPLGLVYLLLAVDALLSLIAYASVSSLVPALVPANPAKAYGVIQVGQTAGRLAGPLAGASLYIFAGAAAVFAVGAALFGILAAAVLAIRRRFTPTSGAHPDRPLSRSGVPYRQLLGSRSVGRPVVVILSSVCFVAMLDTAMIFYATGTLDAGDRGFASILTAWSVGFLIQTRLPLPKAQPGLSRQALWATLALGLVVFIDALLAIYAVTLVCGLAAGVAHGLQNRITATLIGISFDDSRRPAAFATFGVLVSTASVGGLAVAGPVVDLLGDRAVVGGVGVLTMAAALVAAGLPLWRDGVTATTATSHTGELSAPLPTTSSYSGTSREQVPQQRPLAGTHDEHHPLGPAPSGLA